MVNKWYGTEDKASSVPRYIHLHICFKTRAHNSTQSVKIKQAATTETPRLS